MIRVRRGRDDRRVTVEMSADSKKKPDEIVRSYIERFDEFSASAGTRPDFWVEPVRKRAIDRFSELGFPTIKDEEWRQTNPAPLTGFPFLPSAGLDAAGPERALADEHLFGVETAAELVFLNGRFCAELSTTGSLPEGVVVESLASALANRRELLENRIGFHPDRADRGLVALNTAFLRDGAFLHVAEGIRLEKPVHFLYLTLGEKTPPMTAPRSLVLVGARGEATILETYSGSAGVVYFTNGLTRFEVGENATVRHLRLQRESEEACHVSSLQVRQEGASRFHSLSFAFGGALARGESEALLDGEGIECVLDGLYIGRGSQLIDNRTLVDHVRPGSESVELFKGILCDEARGVFSGKIVVRREAQKTDAKQTNRALLLSKGARVHTRPQLEIYADDVKCAHGATIGRLDEEALFYLRARGIGREAARRMLIRSFAGDLIDRVPFEPLRRRVEEIMTERLPVNGGSGGKR